MTKDEALKLALEALEGVLDDVPKVLDASISGGLYEVVQCREAITTIKEALAQQEPWEKFCDSNCVWTDHHPDCKLAQPEQEPVAWHTEDHLTDRSATTYSKEIADKWKAKGWSVTPLFTSPPQRIWVGLTEDEILADDTLRYHFGMNGGAGPLSKKGKAIIEAVTAMLKERNT